MADSTLSIQSDGGDQLDRAIRGLAGANRLVSDDSQTAIRELAESLAKQAAARVLGQPTHGMKHTGLRARVSAGVGTSQMADGTMVTTSMDKSNEAIIPRGFDTAVGGRWRHPLFGNTERWYYNFGAFSWFMGTMNNGADDGRDRLIAILERAAANIAAQT